MSIDPQRRYARHRLLAEIGDTGQARLCAATLRLAGGGDPGASEWARRYLERAGPRLADDRGNDQGGDRVEAVAVASPEAVATLAGDPLLHDAAAGLAGAFAAVEAIKAITGAGQPASLPSALVLSGDESA